MEESENLQAVQTMTPVRVRFAPSPTGAPHVGNLRTALFTWLWARHTGGKFILRVEDTDQAREVENGLELILESLRVLGLDWDEGPDVGGSYGPYRQSERLDIYAKYGQELLAKGAAYYCYCTPERLEEMRKEQQARGEQTRYDRRCRWYTPAERAIHESAGEPKVVRLAVPLDGKTTVPDFIHGDLTIANKDVDDQILLKSDGFPTYHFAVVVDDHLMKISHVTRGDDWIPSFPKHVLLYRAFGWEMPLFGHFPNVLGPDKKKLSKRHGATSVLQFRDEGYLQEALVNFLALLGWSLDDKTELFTRDELIRVFSLERIHPSPAIFDRNKLDWMNGHYIRTLSTDDLASRLFDYLEFKKMRVDRQTVRDATPLIQERIKTLAEAIPYLDFFFEQDLEYDPQVILGQKVTASQAIGVIDSVLLTLDQRNFDLPDEFEAELRKQALALNLKNTQYFGVIRVAVTGKTISPPLMGTLKILGVERVRRRLMRARMMLEGMR